MLTPSLDDNLFVALCFVGWHCLMRLGELVDNDIIALRSFRKSIRHSSVKFRDEPHPHVSFFLLMHKADRFFEGPTVVLEKREGVLDPLQIFKNYLFMRNTRFPHLPDLWLRKTGCLPTRSWFISRLQSVINDPNMAGHSLCSGGATTLALTGTPLDHIHLIGCWSSEAFLIYLRQNPILIQSTLASRSTFDAQCAERLL
jgi:hypothetical protein